MMKQCHFCNNGIKEIDYKETEILGRFLDDHMRIMRHTKTGTCTKHQTKLESAIKRARIMALMPFVKG